MVRLQTCSVAGAKTVEFCPGNWTPVSRAVVAVAAQCVVNAAAVCTVSSGLRRARKLGRFTGDGLTDAGAQIAGKSVVTGRDGVTISPSADPPVAMRQTPLGDLAVPLSRCTAANVSCHRHDDCRQQLRGCLEPYDRGRVCA